MTEAGERRRAEYEAFRLETANELMGLIRQAESVVMREPVFAHYQHELYRLRNHLTLQIENTLKVQNK